MDELIKKALEIKKDEDEELQKLLEESGFVIASLLFVLINRTQETVDDALQGDLESIIDIAEQIHEKFLKAPSDKKIRQLLNKRTFVKDFKKDVVPTLTDALKEIGEGIAEYYNTTFKYPKITKRTKKELESWLKELPQIMKLSTDSEVTKLINQSFEEGRGINWLRARLSESPEFSYARSKTTAITEILTMQSYGSFENIMQSKSVTGARWRHSTGVKEPRANHEALDGVVIPKGTEFDLGVESCLYPRQPKLSPKERIHCHCWLEPVVNEKYKEVE